MSKNETTESETDSPTTEIDLELNSIHLSIYLDPLVFNWLFKSWVSKQTNFGQNQQKYHYSQTVKQNTIFPEGY